MLLARLKAETRDSHERVERTLGLLDHIPTADEYRALLRRFYGYYAPVEERLAGLPWGELGFRWDDRRKTHLLERDLHALGDDADRVATLSRCSALPPLDDIPGGLGCLYVLEGATLGGQVITRHLAREPGAPLPAAFFGSDGADVGRRWKEFGAFLTTWASERSADDVIVDSARQTFDTLGAWLDAGKEQS